MKKLPNAIIVLLILLLTVTPVFAAPPGKGEISVKPGDSISQLTIRYDITELADKPVVSAAYRWDSLTVPEIDPDTVVWLKIQDNLTAGNIAYIRLDPAPGRRGEWTREFTGSDGWPSVLTATYTGKNTLDYVDAAAAKQFWLNGFKVVDAQFSKKIEAKLHEDPKNDYGMWTNWEVLKDYPGIYVRTQLERYDAARRMFIWKVQVQNKTPQRLSITVGFYDKFNRQSAPRHRAVDIAPGATADFPATYLPVGWYNPAGGRGWAIAVDYADVQLTPIQPQAPPTPPQQAQPPAPLPTVQKPPPPPPASVGKWQIRLAGDGREFTWKVQQSGAWYSVTEQQISGGRGRIDKNGLVKNGHLAFVIYDEEKRQHIEIEMVVEQQAVKVTYNDGSYFEIPMTKLDSTVQLTPIQPQVPPTPQQQQPQQAQPPSPAPQPSVQKPPPPQPASVGKWQIRLAGDGREFTWKVQQSGAWYSVTEQQISGGRGRIDKNGLVKNGHLAFVIYDEEKRQHIEIEMVVEQQAVKVTYSDGSYFEIPLTKLDR